MLRKFKIRIDGKEYLVEMEEEGAVQTAAAPAAPVAAVPVAEAPAAPVAAVPVAEAPAAAVPAGSDALTAPMPGNVLKILVNVGDKVEENQPVLILEAMKMENQIVADKSGTVTALHVSEGKVVNPGDALLTIQ